MSKCVHVSVEAMGTLFFGLVAIRPTYLLICRIRQRQMADVNCAHRRQIVFDRFSIKKLMPRISLFSSSAVLETNYFHVSFIFGN